MAEKAGISVEQKQEISQNHDPINRVWREEVGKSILENGADPVAVKAKIAEAKQSIEDGKLPQREVPASKPSKSKEDWYRRKNTEALGEWALKWNEQKGSPQDFVEELADQRAATRMYNSIGELSPEAIKPMSGGSVSWRGTLGSITDTTLIDLLDFHDLSYEDTTEKRAHLKELYSDVMKSTANPTEKRMILDKIKDVLATQGTRLDTNEAKGAYGSAFSPEFPKSPEILVDYVRLQLEELTQLKDDPPPVGWASRIIVTTGGFMTVSLYDPRFETSPIGNTPITITDKEGTRVLPLSEYLRNEVGAAEKVTREAYAYASFKGDKGYGAVSDNSLGNDVYRNLGTIIDSTKIGSGKYLGDTIGRCFDIYKQLAEGRDVMGITYNPFTVSIGKSSSFDEEQTRELIAKTYAGGSKYAEQLAYNLALANGFSSEGNKAGTMSGTSHTAFIDRAFHLNTWRGKKEDKSGPDWTRDKDFFPERLLLDATEMTTIEKGGIIRTIAGLLRDNTYKFRELEWSKLPEFHRKFVINMGDAFSAFSDIVTFPDEVKSAETSLRAVRDHFRNAWAEELFFYKVIKDVKGKVIKIETIDGKIRADVDKTFNKNRAVAAAMEGWVDGELIEAKRTRDNKSRVTIYNAAVASRLISKKFFI